MSTKRESRLETLLPSFRVRVEELVKRLTLQGFDPIVLETYRSPERAAQLAKGGTGVALSMHCYGAACDIVSRSRLYDHPLFYRALGRTAKSLGMTWGGDWKRVDSVHCQAVSVAQQAVFRGLKPEDRDAFVKVALGAIKPVLPVKPSSKPAR